MREQQPDARLGDIAKALSTSPEYVQNVLARNKRGRPREEHEQSTYPPTTHALPAEETTRGLELVQIRRTPRDELRDDADRADKDAPADEADADQEDVVHACGQCKQTVDAAAPSCPHCGADFQ